jgi:hypothetical protein
VNVTIPVEELYAVTVPLEICVLEVFIKTAIFVEVIFDVFEPVIVAVSEPVDAPTDKVAVSNKDVCETLVGREYAITVVVVEDSR